MSNALLKTFQKKNVTAKEIDAELKKLSRNSSLLTFNVLSSKQINPEIRKKYLSRILQLFTVDELSSKWKTSKTNVYRFYITNNLPVFEGSNLFEREINILLDCGNKHGEVRRKIHSLLSDYTMDSILEHYKLSMYDMQYYGHLIGFDANSYCEDKSNMSLSEIPEWFALTLSDEEIMKKRDEKKDMSVKTTVDISSGLVLKTEYEKNPENTINKDVKKQVEALYKTPISIITFLNLTYQERKERLELLMDKLKSDEIEKILGIPSGEYFRKLKIRHMIFDFRSKEKLKNAFEKLKSFQACQALVLDIAKNKRFKEFNISEEKFIVFADKYFDVVKRKSEWSFDNWDVFYKKIVTQAINVYKKNTRITNLTDSEVLKFEKDNRKVVTDNDLIRITRTVIKEIHADNQTWISIFDFKTAIEKEGFELDSNDRIISIIDSLIAKKSFKNEHFTLKKIPLDNPILSDESSIRWEFVSTKPVEVEKPVNKILNKEVKVNEKIDMKVDDPTLKPISGKKDFLTSNIISFNFSESNIDEVIDFIKMNFKLFGNGNATITISKTE